MSEVNLYLAGESRDFVCGGIIRYLGLSRQRTGEIYFKSSHFFNRDEISSKYTIGHLLGTV